MNIGFEALTYHAYGVANAVLRVDQEFVRQNVQHFAVRRQRDVARGVDGTAHVFTLDVARAVADADAPAAVHAAHMAAGHTNHRGFHGNVSDAFGFFHGAANGADGGIE